MTWPSSTRVRPAPTASATLGEVAGSAVGALVRLDEQPEVGQVDPLDHEQVHRGDEQRGHLLSRRVWTGHVNPEPLGPQTAAVAELNDGIEVCAVLVGCCHGSKIGPGDHAGKASYRSAADSVASESIASPVGFRLLIERPHEEMLMTETSTSRGGPVAGGGAASLPTAVDRDTFQAELDGLRLREKALTRENDAVAAARRRLPMVEVDAGTRADRTGRPTHPARRVRRAPTADRLLLHVALRLLCCRGVRRLHVLHRSGP